MLIFPSLGCAGFHHSIAQGELRSHQAWRRGSDRDSIPFLHQSGRMLPMKVHVVVVVHGNENKLLPTALKDSVASLQPCRCHFQVSDDLQYVGQSWMHLRLWYGQTFLTRSLSSRPFTQGQLTPHQNAGTVDQICWFQICNRNGLSPRFSVTTDWSGKSYFSPKVFDVLMGAVSRSIVIVSLPLITKNTQPHHCIFGDNSNVGMYQTLPPLSVQKEWHWLPRISHSVVILAGPTDVGSLMLAPTTVMSKCLPWYLSLLLIRKSLNKWTNGVLLVPLCQTQLRPWSKDC